VGRVRQSKSEKWYIYYALTCRVRLYLNLSTLESYCNLRTCLEGKPNTLQRLVKKKF